MSLNQNTNDAWAATKVFGAPSFFLMAGVSAQQIHEYFAKTKTRKLIGFLLSVAIGAALFAGYGFALMHMIAGSSLIHVTFSAAQYVLGVEISAGIGAAIGLFFGARGAKLGLAKSEGTLRSAGLGSMPAAVCQLLGIACLPLVVLGLLMDAGWALGCGVKGLLMDAGWALGRGVKGLAKRFASTAKSTANAPIIIVHSIYDDPGSDNIVDTIHTENLSTYQPPASRSLQVTSNYIAKRLRHALDDLISSSAHKSSVVTHAYQPPLDITNRNYSTITELAQRALADKIFNAQPIKVTEEIVDTAKLISAELSFVR